MFRPLLGYPQALQENRSKNCLYNIKISWIYFLGGPKDDPIKVETCSPDKYTIFIVYKIRCCVSD